MTESEQQDAIARENLCRYLSACYYEPDKAMAEEDMFGSLVAAADRLDPSLAAVGKRLAAAYGATPLEELLLDYTRLFLGPMEILAKPYGSVWLDQAWVLGGDSTFAVEEIYGEADFEMDDSFKELPDHIAVELEFLYLLIFRINEAEIAGNPERKAFLEMLRQRFLSQHLGRWIAPLANAMRTHARTGFYVDLADLTEAFVRREVETLDVSG